MLKRTLSMALAASLAAGCAVGPDYIRPGAPLAPHYAGQTAVAQRPAGASADMAVWWEGFGDPLLTRFVTLALEQNLDLAQASARVTQARAGLGAADAALLPSGGVSAQGTRSHASLETPLGQVLHAQPGFNRNGDAYEANLGAGWELDVFGGLRRGREAALADYQASEAGAVAARLAVAAQTADLYIGIRGLQTRLDIARKQVQTQQELLATIRQLYDKGLAAELQVRQAEGALAQVQASIPVLAAGLDTTMNALDVMLGAPPGTHRGELNAYAGFDPGIHTASGNGSAIGPDTGPDTRRNPGVNAGPNIGPNTGPNPGAIRATIPAAPQIAAAGSPGDLLRRRPDLIVAERRLAAANARIGAAVAEYYPKLSLSGLIGSATSVSAGNLFTSGAGQAAGVLGLRWRLFDFGRINAQIEQAKGQEAEALAAYRLSVLHAAEDVENAFSALLNREEQAAVLARGVDSLGRARAASFAAYQQGVVSLVEVLQADENLLRASDMQAQAQTESARAAVAAFRALGGGWRPPEADAVALK